MSDKLSRVRVADTAIKPAVRKALMARFGDDVTLDVVANTPKATLLAMDGIGKAGLQSCVGAIGEAFKAPVTIMDELQEDLPQTRYTSNITQQDFDRMIEMLSNLTAAIERGNFHICGTANTETENAICFDLGHAEPQRAPNIDDAH